MSSGPSGPSIPRAARRRQKTELSISAEGRAALDELWSRYPHLTRPRVAELAWIAAVRGVSLATLAAPAASGPRPNKID